MEIAGIGKVIFWAGGSLWIGRALAPTEVHAHHAIQIGIGLSDRLQFRPRADATWDSYAATFIPPGVSHAFQAPGKIVANLFCEPESALGRALMARFGASDLTDLAATDVASHAKALRSAFEAGAPDEDLEQAALDSLYALSESRPVQPVDQRILRAADFIGRRLADALTLDETAQHVGLSAGRFRHLFVKETGIPFRAYLLWTRLNRALELGFGGTSWTEAAHATHFADSAHLSRTTRRMYGLSPTSIRQDLPATARPLSA
jgi:AraC-like DNA-binding protein